MDWAELARRLRNEARDWKQVELAAAIGKTQGVVSQYLSGQAHPRLETLVRLAEVLEVPLDYLVGRQAESGLGDEGTYLSPESSMLFVAETASNPTGAVLSAERMLTHPPQLDPERVRAATRPWANTTTRVLWIGQLPFIPFLHLKKPVKAMPFSLQGIPRSELAFGDGQFDNVALVPYGLISQIVSDHDDIPFGRIVIADVSGDCMEPTIRDGSMVYLDRGSDLSGPELPERWGQIYAVSTNRGLSIKRVWLTGRSLNCHCDNRSKEPFVIDIEHGQKPHDYLAARVIRVVNTL